MADNRYIRQTLLDRIGAEGQDRLSASHVAVIGCGGLGSIAAPYLAGAGVGRITLVDGDFPNITNLHRQVFFSEDETATKALALKSHIEKLNSEIRVDAVEEMISKDNIEIILEQCTLVLECTDNIQAKYLVNDYCHMSQIPLVYGAIHKYDGFVSFFENRHEGSIHLRDAFPVPNDDIPSCSEVGVLGTLAGMIGLIQANEAIKRITQAGETLDGKLLSYDILTNQQMILKLVKNWKEDIKEVYDNSDYKIDQSCTISEISWNTISESRDDYEVISILEDYEHKSIDNQVERMPLSSFDISNWQPANSKPHVFYCLSGMRSSALVDRLAEQEIQLYSLKGGLNNY